MMINIAYLEPQFFKIPQTTNVNINAEHRLYRDFQYVQMPEFCFIINSILNKTQLERFSQLVRTNLVSQFDCSNVVFLLIFFLMIQFQLSATYIYMNTSFTDNYKFEEFFMNEPVHKKYLAISLDSYKNNIFEYSIRLEGNIYPFRNTMDLGNELKFKFFLNFLITSRCLSRYEPNV